jgi:pimeloyl-ACP methyl ester carboxylesterase
MTGAATNKPSLAIFVHGFRSSVECWNQLRKLLEADPRVVSSFDLAFIRYDTAALAVSRLWSVPSIGKVAGDLAAFVARKEFACYREITLVGHSLGGLVIQRYIADTLKGDQGDDLKRIRQVILFATPNRGSLKLNALRRAVGLIFPNAQEESLRVLSRDISDLESLMARNVVDAVAGVAGACPIPFQCFYGEDDDIVVEPSARGCFDCAEQLPGDHSAIIRPDAGSDHYNRIVAALLEPAAHRNVFEIDEWGFSLKVEPHPKDVPVVAVYGRRRREFFTDNFAHLRRSVRFARKNLCADKFDLSYSTRNSGYLKPQPSHANEEEATKQERYEDAGCNYFYKFTPKAGELFTLDVDIYKGFDAGDRDVHFHLGNRSRYKRLRARLDLTAYLAAGFAVTKGPKLYLHERDTGAHSELCASRALEEPLACSRVDPRGVWEWEFKDARGGVVDLKWDIDEGAG